MEYKNGVYFSWFFQHYTITQIFFRFGGKIKEPPSQNLHSENSWKDTKMRFIFHGFFSTKRWHKYFFNLTARSKRRQLIIELSWNFSKVQKWSLFFLIFSALYVTQLFFRFDGRIKVSPSQHLNSEKFLIDHIMGFIFHDFSALCKRIFFPFWRQDQSAAVIKYDFGKS